jgi:hypothetical protein
MHPKLREAFEEIDADVFNGDSIANDLWLARKYISRWLERMPELASPSVSDEKTSGRIEDAPITDSQMRAHNPLESKCGAVQAAASDVATTTPAGGPEEAGIHPDAYEGRFPCRIVETSSRMCRFGTKSCEEATHAQRASEAMLFEEGEAWAQGFRKHHWLTEEDDWDAVIDFMARAYEAGAMRAYGQKRVGYG